MTTHVSLFSGYGGLDLGLKMAIPDLRTVLYCEYDRYAQGVLISRMRDGGLDTAPIWTDVRTLDGRPWRGCVDIISGGFPCQDVSVAGKRAGVVKGNRSGLWFEYARLIDEIRPAIAFIENVAGLVSNGFDRVLCDLAAMGYDAEWDVVSAADAGANHKRERLWIMAYTASADTRQLITDICERAQSFTGGGDIWRQPFGCCYEENATYTDSKHDFWRREPRLANGEEWQARPEPERFRSYESLADTDEQHGKEHERGNQLQEASGEISSRLDSRSTRGDWWEVEPGMGRVVDGCAFRVHRLRLLGNGVVRHQAALAFQILSQRVKATYEVKR